MRKAIAELPQIGLVPAEGTCRDEQAERVWMPIATLLEQLVQAFPGDPAVQPLQDQIEQWMRTPLLRFLPMQLVRTLRTWNACTRQRKPSPPHDGSLRRWATNSYGHAVCWHKPKLRFYAPVLTKRKHCCKQFNR